MSRSRVITDLEVEYNVDPLNTDLCQILVLENSGKILASKKINVHANNIRVHNDRLFLIDTYINMKIYEFKISIQEIL